MTAATVTAKVDVANLEAVRGLIETLLEVAAHARANDSLAANDQIADDIEDALLTFKQEVESA